MDHDDGTTPIDFVRRPPVESVRQCLSASAKIASLGVGTYVGWLAHVAATRSRAAADALKQSVLRRDSVRDLERTLEPWLPPLRIASSVFDLGAPLPIGIELTLARLQLSRHAQVVLRNFVRYCRARSSIIAIDLDEGIESIAGLASDPDALAALDAVLRRSAGAPLGVLRVAWALAAYVDGTLVTAKLAELLDGGAHLHDETDECERCDDAGHAQRGAFVRDAEVQRLASALLAFKPFGRALDGRWRATSEALQPHTREVPSPELLLAALRACDDGDASEILADVSAGRVRLIVRSPAVFRAAALLSNPKLAPVIDRMSAYYTPSLHDEGGGDRAPAMVLRLAPNPLHAERLADVLGTLVHEHEHFRYLGCDARRSSDQVVIGELRSVLRQTCWLLRHGRTSRLESYSTAGVQGLAMGMRAELEHVYLVEGLATGGPRRDLRGAL